jgi:hypothetical protein
MLDQEKREIERLLKFWQRFVVVLLATILLIMFGLGLAIASNHFPPENSGAPEMVTE